MNKGPGEQYMENERKESANTENNNKSGHNAIIKNVAITVVCVILGIVITLQYRSLSASNAATTSDSDRIASLQAQQLRLIQENETMLAEREELEKKINELENATNEEQIRALEKELSNIKMFAGITPVTGRGIYLSISVREPMFEATLQRHLLKIINELKASTAQAISFNGERLTSMTEIRVAGEYVVINGRQHSQPFEIYAIGNPQAMISGLILSGNGPLADLQNEGKCDITYEIRDEIVINACREEDIITGLLKAAK